MTHVQSGLRPKLAADEGLGLIEIVVAMLLLAVLALAMLPVLITGMAQSTANTTFATATQLVNTQMQLAHSRGTLCADIAAMAGTSTLTDPRGVVLTATTTVATCPSGIGTVRVSTAVTRPGSTDPVASSSTLVYVTG
jgi:Tfp pilus assembly protein PilV